MPMRPWTLAPIAGSAGRVAAGMRAVQVVPASVECMTIAALPGIAANSSDPSDLCAVEDLSVERRRSLR
jgi:hypothetical protein